MKKAEKKNLFLALAILTIGLTGSGIFASQIEKETDQIVSYITIGMDHTELAVDQNVHDIQRAEEHFSDMVLGWSVAPDFNEEFEYNYSGRRQEKQNLIFTIDTKEREVSESFADELEERINEYNQATGGSFVIARETHTARVLTRSPFRITMAGGLASLLFAFIMIALIKIHHAHRN